jgi:hypothetical protein
MPTFILIPPTSEALYRQLIRALSLQDGEEVYLQANPQLPEVTKDRWVLATR